MKIFLWYAGVLAACYVALLAYVLIFRRSGARRERCQHDERGA
jgi:hypothetical protein